MDRFLFTRFLSFRCKESVFYLALSWILGLIFGASFGLASENISTTAMHRALISTPSFPGLLSAAMLPALFSAFAVYISKPVLLIPIAFCKAFLFSYLSLEVLTAFGSAGWLIHLLFLFSDTLMLPLLWSFWLKTEHHDRNSTLCCTVPVLITALMIGSIEYCFISPFLAHILS